MSPKLQMCRIIGFECWECFRIIRYWPSSKIADSTRKSLNNLPGTSGSADCYTPSPIPDPVVGRNSNFEGSTRQKTLPFFHRQSFHLLSRSFIMENDTCASQPRLERRFSVFYQVTFGPRPSDHNHSYLWGSSDDKNKPGKSPSTIAFSPISYGEDRERSSRDYKYCLVASKQMVGIFLTMWVRNDLTDAVRNIKVSCVGRDLIGYLGNKGLISISMHLHRTSFCFVCTHLTSGKKEGDELRRNTDVLEILRKTRFPRVNGLRDEKSPKTIIEHDRVIWLGDLNYQTSLLSFCKDTR